MIHIAAKHYLTSLGDKAFVANPDSPEFLTASCLDVVIKKRPKRFWQKPVYNIDNFGLNDLLDVPFPTDLKRFLKKPVPLNSAFKWTSKHKTSGKVGAKLASLVSMDISGGEFITVSIELKDLMIQSIDFSAVQKELKTKKVDINGNYLNRLAQDKHNVLCLVSQYIYINSPTEITVNVSSDFSENADIANKTAGIDDKGTYESSKQKSLSYASGTRIAFSFSECVISPDGQIELLDLSDQVNTMHMIPGAKKITSSLCCQKNDTVDNHNVDRVNSGDKDDLFEELKGLSYLRDDKRISPIKKSILNLALEDRSIIMKLEIFLLHFQQDLCDSELRLDLLKIFEKEMLVNGNLTNIFKEMELTVEGTSITVLDPSTYENLVSGMICIVEAIYRLQSVHLQNLQSIISRCEPSKIQELLLFLQSLKLQTPFSRGIYDHLAKHDGMRSLLSVLGVQPDRCELNEYFEPVFVLLYEWY